MDDINLWYKLSLKLIRKIGRCKSDNVLLLITSRKTTRKQNIDTLRNYILNN